MTEAPITITAVSGKKGRAAFVDLGRKFSAQVPNFVPQLRGEQLELVNPHKNPFFEHARVQLFIAFHGDEPVGRISAQIDELALTIPAEQGMGPGTGMFGYYDAVDQRVGDALLKAAEDWLRGQAMTRVLGPISMSIWEEPGLLVRGQDHAPMLMMGHHPAHYQAWIESAGYTPAKRLFTYDLPIGDHFPALVERIVKSGQRNERINIRPVDKSDFEQEVRIILHILNDAWSGNWGFVPFTDTEISYAARKMLPLIHPELVRIAELDGKPVAFMITFPDVNEALAQTGGKLFPLGWFTLLRWIRKPRGKHMRVPLMGVLKEYHNSRLASQLAFMMIELIRHEAVNKFGASRAEIGWILDDNQGMVAIADTIGGTINREYLIYQKSL